MDGDGTCDAMRVVVIFTNNSPRASSFSSGKKSITNCRIPGSMCVPHQRTPDDEAKQGRLATTEAGPTRE
eukprot:9312534-Karenia_brevis.AAC.1